MNSLKVYAKLYEGHGFNNTFFVKKEGQFLNSLKVYAKLYEGHGFWYVGALFCYFYGIKNGVYYGKCA